MKDRNGSGTSQKRDQDVPKADVLLGTHTSTWRTGGTGERFGIACASSHLFLPNGPLGIYATPLINIINSKDSSYLPFQVKCAGP
jgi:hypothetical protein